VLVLDSGGHTAFIEKVLFTPDGRQLISLSQDKTIRIWDVESGQPLRVLRPPIGSGREGELHAGAISPDGRTLAAGGHGLAGEEKTGVGVYLIDLPSGRMRTLRGHKGTIHSLAFAPDGKRLASGSDDKTVRVWDLESGTCERTLVGHTGRVLDLAFCPAGGALLASAGHDKMVRLWDTAAGKEKAALRHPNDVFAVAWSPDGKRLVSGGWRLPELRVWDADGTPRPTIGLSEAFHDIFGLAFLDAEGREVLASGKRSAAGWEYGAVRADLSTGKAGRALVLGRSATSLRPTLAVHIDRGLAVTNGGEDNDVILWRLADGKVVHRMRGQGQPVYHVGWGKREDALAWTMSRKAGERVGADVAFRLADLQWSPRKDRADFLWAQRLLGTLAVSPTPQNTLAVTSKDRPLWTLPAPWGMDQYTLMPGERLAVAGDFGVRLYDVRTGKVLDQFTASGGRVTSVAPSPDGRYLVTAHGDETVRVLQPGQPAPLLSVFAARGQWVAWTEEGYYAASAGGERLMGWQVNNGPDALATFYPAAQFRSSLYRPDVIQRVLAEGSVAKALAAADAARGKGSAAAVAVEEVLPPEVTLTAPGLKELRLMKPILEVQAEARGKGKHPVTALQLLIDGRPYQEGKGLRRVAGTPAGAVKEKWTVKLTPGEHSLRVLARSAVSTGFSNDLAVSYAVAEPLPRLYVLSVGINTYKDRNLKLDCAVLDAAGLAKTFQEKSKGIYDVRPMPLTEDAATRKSILGGFGWLKEQMRGTDTAVVFFAGHGERDDKGRFYLLPQDVDRGRLAETAISGEELKQYLADLPGKVLLLLDACHSGAIGRVINEMARELGDEDSGVVAMCAATPREKAGESQKDGHGFFCLAVLEALEGKGPKSPRDGCVYIHHLGQYVYDRVQELSNDEQHPTTPQPGIRPFRLARP
jgi:WD40 repeat protein